MGDRILSDGFKIRLNSGNRNRSDASGVIRWLLVFPGQIRRPDSKGSERTLPTRNQRIRQVKSVASDMNRPISMAGNCRNYTYCTEPQDNIIRYNMSYTHHRTIPEPTRTSQLLIIDFATSDNIIPRQNNSPTPATMIPTLNIYKKQQCLYNKNKIWKPLQNNQTPTDIAQYISLYIYRTNQNHQKNIHKHT